MNENNLFQEFHQKMLSGFPDMYDDTDAFESIGITLCLMPVIQPELLENILRQDFGTEGDFPLFGGIRGTQHRGILPTGETWICFCCNNDLEERIPFIKKIPAYLSHPEAYLNIEQALTGEPFLSGRLVFSHSFRNKFQHESIIYENRLTQLMLGAFIHSSLSLSDLVLPAHVLESIEEIRHWQYFHNRPISQNGQFSKRIRKGLKILFYGKSGTGKTQTACILGHELEKKVYRIDLSQVVSKYIGETEKNLARIFEIAEFKQWILFFDEGDALFGKRTAVNSSNDRYANQEVAYLLQRIEEYTGIIILSTNIKDNIDTAFLRRFQIITEFPLPDKYERIIIWKKLLAEVNEHTISGDRFEEISKTELSGGSITNIINYALLKSTYLNTTINVQLIKEGIVRELRKENRLTSL